MELERVGGGDDGRRGDRPQPEPQKCPRCDSLNTKFCYYNNYSLTQPRYFCKTCRRYWTQGGTLRNVPVGGGCRKGKRAKSSPSSSSSENQPPQKVVASLPPPVPSFYQGGGVGEYFASLAPFNQLNQQHPFDQSLNLNVGGSGCSNLGLLQGFNAAAASSIRPPPQFYQMGNGGMESMDVVSSMYNSNTTSQQGLNLIPSTMANTTAAATQHHDHHWSQSFINNAATNRASDASLWSTISTASIADRSVAGSSTSLVPNQWLHLQGLNHQGFPPHPPPPPPPPQ